MKKNFENVKIERRNKKHREENRRKKKKLEYNFRISQ